MADEYHVVAIMTVMDEWSGLFRLAKALCEIDASCPAAGQSRSEPERQSQEGQMTGKASDFVRASMQLLTQVIAGQKEAPPVHTMKEVLEAEAAELEVVAFENSPGHIAAETIYLYPPGIPLILSGERITRAAVELIQQYRREHLPVQGMSDRTGRTVRCLK